VKLKRNHKVNFTLVSGKLSVFCLVKVFLALFKRYENDCNCLFLKNI